MKRKILTLLFAFIFILSGCGKNTEVVKDTSSVEEQTVRKDNVDDIIQEVSRAAANDEQKRESELTEQYKSSDVDSIKKFIGNNKISKLGDYVINKRKNTLQIGLYSKRSDIYRWVAVSDNPSIDLLDITSESFMSLYSKDYFEEGYVLNSNSAIDLFTFRFSENGSYVIKFQYKNSWGEEDDIKRTYNLNVTVEDGIIIYSGFSDYNILDDEILDEEDSLEIIGEDMDSDEINDDFVEENEEEVIENIENEESSDISSGVIIIR